MLKSPEPKLGQNAEELDAGWEEPAAPATSPPRPSGVSVAPVAVATDELDEAWDDAQLPTEPLVALRRAASAAEPSFLPRVPAPRAEPPGAQQAATVRAEPASAKTVVTAAQAPRSAPQTAVTKVARAVPVSPLDAAVPPPGAPAPALRTLSKKERRALERKQRAHATRKGSERKQSARAKRREEAQRLAEERQAERRAALTAAKERAREEKRATNKARPKRAATAEVVERAAAKSGTKRQAVVTPRTKGRPKKYSGGGFILVIIALVTLATGLYAWSKR
jgi:hypothetical protein